MHNLFQFDSRDGAIPILIKHLESLLDLIICISFSGFASHHGEEFRKIDRAVSVCVNFVDHLR